MSQFDPSLTMQAAPFGDAGSPVIVSTKTLTTKKTLA
ncbi:hypothetical protein GALL_116730 [mine drainage metagenome]|uniref:Uncharacterized protein n=1 Tax=mine drainage metagenome TaxID=410659 RepID=A0A1J5SQA3_9ZZZZ